MAGAGGGGAVDRGSWRALASDPSRGGPVPWSSRGPEMSPHKPGRLRFTGEGQGALRACATCQASAASKCLSATPEDDIIIARLGIE